jgi:hypothetical protein
MMITSKSGDHSEFESHAICGYTNEQDAKDHVVAAQRYLGRGRESLGSMIILKR